MLTLKKNLLQEYIKLFVESTNDSIIDQLIQVPSDPKKFEDFVEAHKPKVWDAIHSLDKNTRTEFNNTMYFCYEAYYKNEDSQEWKDAVQAIDEFKELLSNVQHKNAIDSLRQPALNEPDSYMIHGYHATPIENTISIIERGIIPGFKPPGGQTWMGTYSGKAIYFHIGLFPDHEIENAVDQDGIVNSSVIETRFSCKAELIVADEDAGRPEDTPEILQDEAGSIAVARKIEPSEIIAIHLPDVQDAHDWVNDNKQSLKNVAIKFQKP